MKNRIVLISILAGSLLTVTAQAQQQVAYYYVDPTRDPGYHSHDGFYLSMNVGAGGLNYDDEAGSDKLTMSGVSTNVDLKIGGAVIRDQLILSADFIDAGAQNPDVTEDGSDQGKASGTLSVGLFGLGVTHYFMPMNAFVSGTVGLGRFIAEDNEGDQSTSDGGLGFQLKAGKEWWVSSNWGLGISAVFLHLGVDEGSGETLSGNSFGVMFNTTYN